MWSSTPGVVGPSKLVPRSEGMWLVISQELQLPSLQDVISCLDKGVTGYFDSRTDSPSLSRRR